MTFASLFQAVAIVFSMILMLVLLVVPRDKDGNILEPPKIFTEEAGRARGKWVLSVLVILVASIAVALKVT